MNFPIRVSLTSLQKNIGIFIVGKRDMSISYFLWAVFQSLSLQLLLSGVKALVCINTFTSKRLNLKCCS